MYNSAIILCMGYGIWYGERGSQPPPLPLPPYFNIWLDLIRINFLSGKG